MFKFFKKLFAWLFVRKPKIEKEQPSFEQFAEEKPFKKPEPLPRKKKEPIVHRIPPDFSSMPNRGSFKRGLGNIQQIIEWDGEYFPGRWRTRLIYHR